MNDDVLIEIDINSFCLLLNPYGVASIRRIPIHNLTELEGIALVLLPTATDEEPAVVWILPDHIDLNSDTGKRLILLVLSGLRRVLRGWTVDIDWDPSETTMDSDALMAYQEVQKQIDDFDYTLLTHSGCGIADWNMLIGGAVLVSSGPVNKSSKPTVSHVCM